MQYLSLIFAYSGSGIMKNNPKDIDSTVNALQEFVKQFGSHDEYTKIVMEILLEELFDKKKESENQ